MARPSSFSIPISAPLGAVAPLLSVFSIVIGANAHAESFGKFPWQKYRAKEADWFAQEKALRIADNLLANRSRHGIWPKNFDTGRRDEGKKSDETRGTFDNGATVGEIRYLAQVYRATDEKRYFQAIKRAIDTILDAQYPNGGWPQSFPPGGGYPRYITLNDHVMVNLLRLVGDVAEREEFDFLDRRRRHCQAAFVRGIDCLLRTQVSVNGTPAVWCAQYDEQTLAPRPARAYEPIALSSAESAEVVLLLMSLEHPSPAVVHAVNGACRWFERSRVYNLRIEEQGDDTRALIDTDAEPLWARFYSVDRNRPMFLGRDGVVHDRLAEIERERRGGYAWYGDWGEPVLRAWPVWYEQHLGVPLVRRDVDVAETPSRPTSNE
ncbi:MAG: pectate lyase [Planctomycetales bacterium]|nr:pectate lyase [Planctomycetales bacterium]